MRVDDFNAVEDGWTVIALIEKFGCCARTANRQITSVSELGYPWADPCHKRATTAADADRCTLQRYIHIIKVCV